MQKHFGFSPSERRILSRLDSPHKIQDFLDRIDYNLEEGGETYFSPRLVMKERKANCFEGAIFAAAALRFHGYPPLIVDLASIRDDDHLLAVFKHNGLWGAIAKSKYTGLQFREPIHRTMRELALSYFEDYFNFSGEKTLRGYSNPVNLSRFDRIGWMTTENGLTCIEDYLNRISHARLMNNGMDKRLRKVTPLMKHAGETWIRDNTVLEKIKTKR